MDKYTIRQERPKILTVQRSAFASKNKPSSRFTVELCFRRFQCLAEWVPRGHRVKIHYLPSYPPTRTRWSECEDGCMSRHHTRVLITGREAFEAFNPLWAGFA